MSAARTQTREAAAARQCRACRHFRNDPAYLEKSFPGLSALSSAYAAVRTDDGLCLHHEAYVGARASCAAFAGWAEDAA